MSKIIRTIINNNQSIGHNSIMLFICVKVFRCVGIVKIVVIRKADLVFCKYDGQYTFNYARHIIFVNRIIVLIANPKLLIM